MIDEEQKLRVLLVGRDGRRRYDPRSKARLIAACLEPCVSISGLALPHGINANVLRKWVKDAKESGSPATFSRSALIPVVAADCSRPVRALSLNIEVARGEDQTVRGITGEDGGAVRFFQNPGVAAERREAFAGMR